MLLATLLIVLVLLAAPATAASKAEVNAAFARWLQETVWPEASAAGVSRASFEEATAGLTPDWKLPDLVPPGSKAKTPSGAWQAEFTNPGGYLADRKIAGVARPGRTLLARWSDTLARVERATGVPAAIVVAIWGRESGFGRADIPYSALRTVATQAFMGSRRAQFHPEFIALLRMVEEDHLPPALMKSSWAGAMGQPQFMPSKFLAYAVDGDGDGRRDIWTSVPDTLASIGYYLQGHGWRAGLPWGAEVRVPDGVSCTLEGPDKGRPWSDWAGWGVTFPDGSPVVGRGDAHLLMPAGRYGPAFLVSANFYVLKAYNESDLYALFVGHSADRMAGAGPIGGSWNPPSGFTRGAVRDLQERLIARGYDVGGADGLVGWRTRIAIGREQEAAGGLATCFPDAALLR